MKYFLFSIIFLLLISCCSSNENNEYIEKIEKMSSNGKKWALLVSVNEFADNGARTLNGPKNDMDVLYKLLHQKYSFPENAILRLHGEKATKKGIIDGLEAIYKKTKDNPNSVVVIGFSSHGSQVDDQPGGDEVDGLDETICVYDRKTAHDIRDDQLFEYLQKILDADADLTLIVDACHSGTVGKDPDGIYRQADPVDGDGYQPENSKGENGSFIGSLTDNPRFVGISAARDHEEAMEKRFYTSPEGQYGVLTHSLATILQDASLYDSWSNLKPKVTALMKNANSRQNMQFTGNSNKKIFSSKEAETKPHFTVDKVSDDGKKITVGIGKIGGISVGGVLAVYSQATGIKIGQESGIYEITNVDDLSCDAVPFPTIRDEGSFSVQVGDMVKILIPGKLFKSYLLKLNQLPETLAKNLKVEFNDPKQHIKVFTLDDKERDKLKDRFFSLDWSKELNAVTISGGPTPKTFYKDDYSGDEAQIFAQMSENIVDLLYNFAQWYQILEIAESDKLIQDTLEIRVSSSEVKRDANGNTVDFIGDTKKLALDREAGAYRVKNQDYALIEYINTTDEKIYVTVMYLNYDGKIYILNEGDASSYLKRGNEIQAQIDISVPTYKVDTKGDGQFVDIEHSAQEYVQIFVSKSPVNFAGYTHVSKSTRDSNDELAKNKASWDLHFLMRGLGNYRGEPGNVGKNLNPWGMIRLPILCVPQKK